MKRVQSSIASFLTGPAQKKSNPTSTQHNSVCTVEEVEVNAPPQENSGDEENSDVDRDAGSVSQHVVGGCIEPARFEIGRASCRGRV